MWSQQQKANKRNRMKQKAHRKFQTHHEWVDCPANLYVTVPENAGTGAYNLVDKQGSAGYPLWKHADEMLWLYMGMDGSWYIGDTEECNESFECVSGYMRSNEPEHDTLPHEVHERQSWQLEQWVPSEIAFVSPDKADFTQRIRVLLEQQKPTV